MSSFSGYVIIIHGSISSQGNKEGSDDVWEPPGDSCPLRDADSQRVVRLTVKVRYICIITHIFCIY